MDAFAELADTIHGSDKMMRIVLFLSESREQYLRSMLNEHIEKSIDLIFDNISFDVKELLNYVKNGKFSHTDTKRKRKTSGFQGDIETSSGNISTVPIRRVEK